MSNFYLFSYSIGSFFSRAGQHFSTTRLKFSRNKSIFTSYYQVQILQATMIPAIRISPIEAGTLLEGAKSCSRLLNGDTLSLSLKISLDSHWEQDCPCPPIQGAPFCEVSEKSHVRIYLYSQRNNSNSSAYWYSTLAVGKGNLALSTQLPCLWSSGTTDLFASSHVQYAILLCVLFFHYWRWHNRKKRVCVVMR